MWDDMQGKEGGGRQLGAKVGGEVLASSRERRNDDGDVKGRKKGRKRRIAAGYRYMMDGMGEMRGVKRLREDGVRR
jgi:hypothetical protein